MLNVGITPPSVNRANQVKFSGRVPNRVGRSLAEKLEEFRRTVKRQLKGTPNHRNDVLKAIKFEHRRVPVTNLDGKKIGEKVQVSIPGAVKFNGHMDQPVEGSGKTIPDATKQCLDNMRGFTIRTVVKGKPVEFKVPFAYNPKN